MDLRRLGPAALICAAVSLTTSCGGNASPPMPPPGAQATFRALQGDPTAGTVNVQVDGSTIGNNVAFLQATGYVTVSAGMHQFVMQSVASGSPIDPGMPYALNLPANTPSTLVVDGVGPFEFGRVLLSDDNMPAAGSAKLRIVQGTLSTPGVLTLDVFILPAGSVPSGTPTLSNMNFNAVSSYQVLAPATYEVFFTATGTTNVVFQTGSLPLAAAQNRTLVLLTTCPGLPPCGAGTYTSVVLPDLN